MSRNETHYRISGTIGEMTIDLTVEPVGGPAEPAPPQPKPPVVERTNADRALRGPPCVWHWLNAPGAPDDLTEYGICPIVKVTWRETCPDKGEPLDENILRAFAETIPDGAFVVTDIEGWPSDGDDAQVAEDSYLAVNRLLREASPDDIAIGQYNAIRSPRLAIERLDWWRDYNREHRARLLADLDVDCSELYAREAVQAAIVPQVAWVRMADRVRDLHNELAPGKPFIPTISPRWWGRDNPLMGQYLPPPLWQAMLGWCEANASGVVVYHGYGNSPSWDEWTATDLWQPLREMWQ